MAAVVPLRQEIHACDNNNNNNFNIDVSFHSEDGNNSSLSVISLESDLILPHATSTKKKNNNHTNSNDVKETIKNNNNVLAADDDDNDHVSVMSEISNFSWGTSTSSNDAGDDGVDVGDNIVVNNNSNIIETAATTTIAASSSSNNNFNNSYNNGYNNSVNSYNNVPIVSVDNSTSRVIVQPHQQQLLGHTVPSPPLCNNNSSDDEVLSFFTAQQQQQHHLVETRTIGAASLSLQRRQQLSSSSSSPPSEIAITLAREVDGLSLEEKIAITDDLFGNNCLYTNELFENSSSQHRHRNHQQHEEEIFATLIEDFHVELEKIIARETAELAKHNNNNNNNSNKTLVYAEALIKCPDVVHTESHPLRFLRCEDYDPKSAAERLIQYWEMRKEIFGEEKAFLPMTLDGAMADETETIMMFPTVFRVLPEDSRGRTVLCFDKDGLDARAFPALKFARYIWYGVHVALMKESTQTKGVVLIVNIPSFSLYEYNPYRTKLTVASFSNCLPLKVRSSHFCINSLFLTFMIPIYIFFLSSSIRRRIQIHHGSQEETLTSLSAFGLHRYGLPTSMGGTFSETMIWVEQCRRKEINAWVNSHPKTT